MPDKKPPNDNWITDTEAIERVCRAYRMPRTPAIAVLQRALASENVEVRDTLVSLEDVSNAPVEGGIVGAPRLLARLVPPRLSPLWPDVFVKDRQINYTELRWQVEQELGPAPVENEAKRPKPELDAVVAWLEKRSRELGKEGGPPLQLKQNDDELRRRCMAETGATDRQFKDAMQKLPHNMRYTRGHS